MENHILKMTRSLKGERPTIYSYPEVKQRIALSRGARGSILIPFHPENFSF